MWELHFLHYLYKLLKNQSVVAVWDIQAKVAKLKNVIWLYIIVPFEDVKMGIFDNS